MAFVIYDTLGKPNVASKTVLMNTGDHYLTIPVAIQRFQKIFLNNNHSDTHVLLIPIQKLL